MNICWTFVLHCRCICFVVFPTNPMSFCLSYTLFSLYPLLSTLCTYMVLRRGCRLVLSSSARLLGTTIAGILPICQNHSPSISLTIPSVHYFRLYILHAVTTPKPEKSGGGVRGLPIGIIFCIGRNWSSKTQKHIGPLFCLFFATRNRYSPDPLLPNFAHSYAEVDNSSLSLAPTYLIFLKVHLNCLYICLIPSVFSKAYCPQFGSAP